LITSSIHGSGEKKILLFLKDFGEILTLKWCWRSNVLHEFPFMCCPFHVLSCVVMVIHENNQLYRHYIHVKL
jgi:hypothetical protein